MPAKEQKKYLPTVFSNLWLGMTLDEFKQIKDISGMEIDENEYVSYYTEPINTPEIQEYIYQFDKNKVLYELIIEYRLDFDISSYMQELYGKPNNGEEWIFEIKEGFKLKIWKFINNFCIANAGYFE
jgi:hypothetical protein